MTSEGESKPEVSHHKDQDASSANVVSTPTVQKEEHAGFNSDFSSLPKGYFYSKFFLGSMLATGLALWAGTGAFAYAAPILSIINADLGPDKNYVWIANVYSVALAVGLGPVGRLSDIFGRRYFFIGGGILAIIGCIVCGTAKSVNTLIGGNVLLGLATATQLSFHFVMGELVPVKWRYAGNATLYLFTIAGSGMGPAISYAFVTRYSVGWRGVYWFLLAINGAALACWILFYFPPTFHDKHKKDIDSKAYWIKNFDYVGTCLFIAGFVVLLLGLSWGGGTYPWKSAAVISAIVLGAVTLTVFVLWEIYAPVKEPLVPMELFKNGRWTASVVLLGLGAGVYYAFSIIWPMQCAVLYNDPSNPMYVGYISVIVGIGIITGQVVFGYLTPYIGHQKYQCIAAFAIGGTFLGCAATVTPDNKSTQVALVFLGCVFIGWNETITLSNSTILIKNQSDIGVAGGIAGSVRAGICAVLTAIYVAILTNRLETTIPAQVPPAIIDAGLPAGSVAQFMTAITAGTTDAFSTVPGITDSIIAVGLRSYKQANADAYRTVFLSTIAFTGISLVLCLFAPNTEEYMNEMVAATLNHEGMKESKENIAEKGVSSEME